MRELREQQVVMVVGGGGREYALGWSLTRSPRLKQLYMVPGNAGTSTFAINVPLDLSDMGALVAFATEKKVDLVVIQLDELLAKGYVDSFRAAGFRTFGATAAAAQIESSKAFAKELMKASDVLTASWATFSELRAALNHIETRSAPMMVKVSGLALGKGAYYCATRNEARRVLVDIMHKKVHGERNITVVIEDVLYGPEISMHAFTDGTAMRLLPPAQDHKKVGEGDTGLNTGGMGVVMPIPWHRPRLMSQVTDEVVRPILAALKDRGRPFEGCIYPGLMDTHTEGLRVLEYNARFGDPETQAYMRRLKTDFLDIADACVDGTLEELVLEWHEGFVATLSLVSGGYPGEYKKGIPIVGIDVANRVPGVVVFHAGTAIKDDTLITNGGRVLNVTALAPTLSEALARAYEAARLIHFDGMYYRRDIGKQALRLAAEHPLQ